MVHVYALKRKGLALLFAFLWGASSYGQSGSPGLPLLSPTLTETFETGSKPDYPAGEVQLSSGAWTLNNAILAGSEADRKEGQQAVRLLQSGRLTMNFFLPAGAGVVTVKHASFGNDGTSSWELWALSDACGCNKWTKVGPSVVTSTNRLQVAAFTVNIPGQVKLEIRKTSGGNARLNLDDLTVESYDPLAPPPVYPSNDHLALGNPSQATADVNNPNNYLMIKPQYALSYSRDRGTPNWVSWHLDASDRGSASRQDDFRPDETLPAGWYQVTQFSYTGSGFDRGHNTPSADRTSSVENNSATFLMTNMIPQAPLNNQQTWNNFEQYTRTFIEANPAYEVYLIMGNYGVGGTGSQGGVTNTIDNGRVTVPNRVWKVAVILPVGDNDVSRISATTRIIAIDTPNTNAIDPNWGAYRTTIDAIEAATGLDLLSSLPVDVQQVVEAKVDNGPVL